MPFSLRPLLADRRGLAAVEMGLVLPLLASFLLGTITYGSWFFIAHSVQQAANDAARAGVGGLSPAERAGMIRTAANRNIGRGDFVDPAATTLMIRDDSQALTVTVAYDAHASAILHNSFVPMPPLQIVRSATVRLDTF
jgi:Flp pilus assembly protein TadG